MRNYKICQMGFNIPRRLYSSTERQADTEDVFRCEKGFPIPFSLKQKARLTRNKSFGRFGHINRAEIGGESPQVSVRV